MGIKCSASHLLDYDETKVQVVVGVFVSCVNILSLSLRCRTGSMDPLGKERTLKYVWGGMPDSPLDIRSRTDPFVVVVFLFLSFSLILIFD